MSRDARIIGAATDIEGVCYDVRERRPTKHGWMIHIGWPQGQPRGKGCGGPKVVLTVDLAMYLTAIRPRDVDLPISNTTAKILRNTLGVRWSWDDWWGTRKADLLTMTLVNFCKKYGCSTGAASQRRAIAKSDCNLDFHGHKMNDKSLRIQIPDDLDFSALKLHRNPVTLDVSFDWAPIEAICKLSGIDIRMFSETPEDNVSELILQWYMEHRQRGGAADPVQEQLIAEVLAEAAAGGQAGVISHGGGLQ